MVFLFCRNLFNSSIAKNIIEIIKENMVKYHFIANLWKNNNVFLEIKDGTKIKIFSNLSEVVE
jgi:hypothetical protein